MIASGRSGMPSVRDSSLAKPMNASVQTVTVGTPSFSRSYESWIHHDVQDPQSPMAVMTALTSLANVSRPRAPTAALGLIFLCTFPMA